MIKSTWLTFRSSSKSFKEDALQLTTSNRLSYFFFKGAINSFSSSMSNTLQSEGRCSASMLVITPVPGPNSTTYFMAFKSSPFTIPWAARLELGIIEALILGCLINILRNLIALITCAIWGWFVVPLVSPIYVIFRWLLQIGKIRGEADQYHPIGRAFLPIVMRLFVLPKSLCFHLTEKA